MIGLIFISLLFSPIMREPGCVHPIHVSVTSIEFQKEGSFSVSFKIFTDDFETILSTKYNITIKINDDPDPKEQIPYFNRYIGDSFGFWINDQMKLVPEYKRKSINEEAVWLYYSFPCTSSVHSIRIHNAIMMDMFDDQKNLLILKFGDFEKGYEFRKDKREISIRLNNGQS